MQAIVDMVQNEQGPNCVIANFESIVSCLFPFDAVAKRKHTGDKRKYTSIFELNAEVITSLVIPKPFIGKTGLCFRNYEQDKVYELLQVQKEELFEHRKSLNKN